MYEIVNTYAGTLYLGHCTADDLLAHYKQTKRIKFDFISFTPCQPFICEEAF